MQFSRVSYRSLSESAGLGSGGASLHLVARGYLVMSEAQVVEQRAKRRGGPKKCWLQFALLDAQGRRLSTHVLAWKAISTKNFSNRLNIEQYERGSFGLMRMDMGAAAAAAGSGSAAFALEVSGEASHGRVSSTIGVNVSGKDVAQHPRFMFSSGKKDVGARTLMQFYSSDPAARVELQCLWIEHREIKISFEQMGDDQPQQMEFASKPPFKHLYAPRPNSDDDAAAMAAEAAHEDFTPPVPRKSAAASALAAADLTPKARRVSARRLSVLPPSKVPAQVAEQLRKRRHSLVESVAELSTLDSPLPHSTAMDDEDDDDFVSNAPEPRKRPASTVPAGASVAMFSGFDSFDCMSIASNGQQVAMRDVPESVGAEFDVEDACPQDEAPSSQEDGSQDTMVAGADTPASSLSSSGRTPYLCAESSDAFPPLLPSPSPDASDFQATLQEAEEHVHRYADRAFQSDDDMYGLHLLQSPPLSKPTCDSAMSPAVPVELAAACAPANPYRLTAYQTNSSAAAEFSMPPALSPAVCLSYPPAAASPFGSPMCAPSLPLLAPSSLLGGVGGSDFHRSPALGGFGADAAGLSPPALSLLHHPASPMPASFLCRSRTGAAAAPPAAALVVVQSPLRSRSGFSPSTLLALTPARTPSAAV